MAEERNPVTTPIVGPVAPDLPAPVPLAASEIDDVDVPRTAARAGMRPDDLAVSTAVGMTATTAPSSVVPPTDDPDEIREQIERTREDMSQTINELQERLSPQHLAQQARASVREATVGRVQELVGTASESASHAARRAQVAAEPMVEQLREHPMPVALAGAGVGLVWWMMRRASARTTWSSDDMYDMDDDDMITGRTYGASTRRTWDDDDRWNTRGGDWTGVLRDYPLPAALAAASIGYMLWTRRSAMDSDDAVAVRSAYDEDMGAEGTTAGVADKAREMRRQAREKANALGEHVTDTVRDARARASEMSQTVSRRLGSARVQTSTQFDRWMQENPMAVGVAALAAGAVIGLSVPRSQVENRTMGATRDALVDRASDSAHHLTEQVRDKVKEVTDDLTADDTSRHSPSSISRPASSSVPSMGSGM